MNNVESLILTCYREPENESARFALADAMDADGRKPIETMMLRMDGEFMVRRNERHGQTGSTLIWIPRDKSIDVFKVEIALGRMESELFICEGCGLSHGQAYRWKGSWRHDGCFWRRPYRSAHVGVDPAKSSERSASVVAPKWEDHLMPWATGLPMSIGMTQELPKESDFLNNITSMMSLGVAIPSSAVREALGLLPPCGYISDSAGFTVNTNVSDSGLDAEALKKIVEHVRAKLSEPEQK